MCDWNSIRVSQVIFLENVRKFSLYENYAERVPKKLLRNSYAMEGAVYILKLYTLSFLLSNTYNTLSIVLIQSLLMFYTIYFHF